jgi:alpha-tubulin suppressor-like RCC1 family protein
MAKRLSGRVVTFGTGDHGRLGHLTLLGSAIPRIVSCLGHERFVEVQCGGAHTAAVSEDGSMYTWGYNDRGQLGHSQFSSYAQAGLQTRIYMNRSANAYSMKDCSHIVKQCTLARMFTRGTHCAGATRGASTRRSNTCCIGRPS